VDDWITGSDLKDLIRSFDKPMAESKPGVFILAPVQLLLQTHWRLGSGVADPVHETIRWVTRGCRNQRARFCRSHVLCSWTATSWNSSLTKLGCTAALPASEVRPVQTLLADVLDLNNKDLYYRL
jgi:hypothetical protein